MAEINAAYDLVRAAAQHDEPAGAAARPSRQAPGHWLIAAAAARARARSCSSSSCPARTSGSSRRRRPGPARARSSPSPSAGCCGCSTTRPSPACTPSRSATWPRSSTASGASTRRSRSARSRAGATSSTICARTLRPGSSALRAGTTVPLATVGGCASRTRSTTSSFARNAQRARLRRVRLPVPGRHRGRRARDPGPAVRLAGEGVVGAARGRHRRLRAGRARALPGARGRARRLRVAVPRRQGLGRPRDHRAPRRQGLVRAGRHRGRAAGGAAPRSPRSAATGAGCRSRSEVAEALLEELPGARLDQRAPRCASQAAGRAGPGAGDADARRELRRVALQARGQLGPGHGRRVRRAARRRGARAHACRSTRTCSSRSSTSSACTRSTSAPTRARRSPGCAPSTTRRSAPSAARAPRTRDALECEPRLGGELRPFQRAGVRYALESRRLFIADEQGLGKTVEALALLEEDDAFPAVVICPASLKLNWQREIQHWLPHRSLHVVVGTGKAIPKADITVLNYEIVHAHRERLRDLAARRR